MIHRAHNLQMRLPTFGARGLVNNHMTSMALVIAVLGRDIVQDILVSDFAAYGGKFCENTLLGFVQLQENRLLLKYVFEGYKPFYDSLHTR
jgi:hypothetical protein